MTTPLPFPPIGGPQISVVEGVPGANPSSSGPLRRFVPGPQNDPQTGGLPRRIGTSGINTAFQYWRQDGNEILYFRDGDLMSVSVTWRGEPSFGEPQKLFSGLRRGAGSAIGARPLAASRDGWRIFWLQGPDLSESNVIHIKTYAIR